MVVHGSPIPLYRQVKRAIATRLDNGSLSPGTRTSEHELSAEFGVSRITVRQALGELAREGRIFRVPGKGTFVAEARKVEPQSALTGFSENIAALGLRPSYRTLAVGEISASAEIIDALEIDEDSVLRVERVMFADETPMAVMTTYFPSRVFARARHLFDAERLNTTSLYSTLEHDLGIVLWKARETVEAAKAGDDADLLDLTRDDLLLVIHRRTLDRAGRPVEYMKARYRADLYRYNVELLRHTTP